MQTEHLCPTQLALLARRLKSLQTLCLFPLSYLFHIRSIRAFRSANTVRYSHLSASRIVDFAWPGCRTTSSFGESFGERGLESSKGENVLGLAEGGSKCAREDAEDGEVLLEFGDQNRKGLCLGIEGSKILFKFADPAGEPGELVGEV